MDVGYYCQLCRIHDTCFLYIDLLIAVLVPKCLLSLFLAKDGQCQVPPLSGTFKMRACLIGCGVDPNDIQSFMNVDYMLRDLTYPTQVNCNTLLLF